MNCQMLSKYPRHSHSDWSVLSPNSPWLVNGDSSLGHTAHRDHHHIPGWENTTKHDNEASQNSFMQHGFSRCWDLLSSVTTRLLNSEILSNTALCRPRYWPSDHGDQHCSPGSLWIILDNYDLDLGMNGDCEGSVRNQDAGVCEPSIVLQAANFSLGPGISSNISNNLWWWNILQWGSDDGDPVLGDTGGHHSFSAADNLISCLRVASRLRTQVWTKHSNILWILCQGIS